MTLNVDLRTGCGSTSSGCSDATGCPEGLASDFCIKRNNTTPPFRMNYQDCDGPVDLSTGNYILQVNIWIKAKLKKTIDNTETEISFADNIGFDLIKENNILTMDRARDPEKMQITGFDEENKTITVIRGYDGTSSQSWSKGTGLRVFRVVDADGEIESVLEDLEQEDGTILKNQLSYTFLKYLWGDETTSLAGCYWLEFKLTELDEEMTEIISAIRLPSEGEGYLIKIIDSPT